MSDYVVNVTGIVKLLLNIFILNEWVNQLFICFGILYAGLNVKMFSLIDCTGKISFFPH